MTTKHAIKLLGVVGGVAGAVATTIASGGTVLVAVLVGVAAATTGLGALYIEPPKGKAKMRAGQQVDTEVPK